MAAEDTHVTEHAPASGSPRNFFAITKHDTNDLAYVTTALIIASAGTVKVDAVGIGTGISIPMGAGYNPGQFTRVYDTGTDDVGTIVGCF